MVGPAGSGKSTLLTQVARGLRVPVAWYRAEDVDSDPAEVLAQLQHAFVPVLGDDSPPWTSVADAARALERTLHARVLLVIDDLHVLEGTPAEVALERFVHYAPPALAVLAASRLPPSWNLSRRRVAGEVAEVNGDDLRFRSWEVERLFRDHYQSPLAPEDLAALTRLTEGWAAGLQLFHLATRDKPPAQRRQTLGFLNSGLPLVREYLVHNVLDELPPELRQFLLDTAVLGRLRSTICDELRGVPGSQALLEELERRQLLTFFLEDGPWYRCHEVLRSHLETTYLETVGELEARSRYQWAGSLLESAGAPSDALRAYCRAEDWEAAGRLLGHKGEELSEAVLEWLDWLPPAVAHHDPWFLLSEARRHRAAGRWQLALAAYHRAERAMPAAAASDACRRERATLSSWLDPTPPPVTDWSGLLRAAVTRDPMSVYRRGSESSNPHLLLVAGLAALVGGCPAAAVPVLTRLLRLEEASPMVSATARMALAAADALGGGDARDVEAAAEQLETLGVSGLTRFTPALRLLSSGSDGAEEAAEVRRASRNTGDRWGESTAALLEGWARLAANGTEPPEAAVEPLEAAITGFAGLGAPVPEALARSLRALAWARRGHPQARTAARQAECGGRAVGSPGAEALATLALTHCEPVDDPRVRDEAGRLLRGCGLAPSGVGFRRPSPEQSRPSEPDVAVRCFRGFSLSIRGRPVNLTGLKPKARKVLRILSLHCPEWVHREMLIEALWPGADPATGTRNIQVVVSSLRHALEPGSARGGSLIARQGDAYRLAVPPDGWVDHLEFRHALVRARAAQAAGDVPTAQAAFTRALDLATGPLLPEDGPDEWVVAKRDHYRSEACHAAHALAEMLAEGGEHEAAVVACERGLALDRCSDPLWRFLIRSSEAAGDMATAARARREYASLLADLGVTEPHP